MSTKPLNAAPERTYVLVLGSGDEVMRCLGRFAREQRLDAARFTAVGAGGFALIDPAA